MKKILRFVIPACAVFLLCVATPTAALAQIFTTLAGFDDTDGAYPTAPLAQGLDGNLYGTTSAGGTGPCYKGCGAIFKVTPHGDLTVFYSFCLQSNCVDGEEPYGGLILAPDGNFYGTTGYGGTYGYGTVFKITPGGLLTTLYSFCAPATCYDGSIPEAGLVQATDGNFYGTTFLGGVNNWGTVFKISSDGALTTLHSFDKVDGSTPYAGLIQATDGNLYGATSGGGANLVGTVFKITPGGTLTTLNNFGGSGGAYPNGTLVQATDGYFYGTTTYGGAYNYGTVFKMNAAGLVVTLHSFDGSDGGAPIGGLVQGTNGTFYGSTVGIIYGTIFEITSTGTLTTLHTFDGNANAGIEPKAGVVQATNGDFYGTTSFDGYYGFGTVFSLSAALGPFVETVPTVGRTGSMVIILGNGLTGATSVTFNGTLATFTVASPTEIKATVPTGATSGKVQVTTPHGTLTSNVVFRVK
jgi:uncharacterized repeat protein (TIGR03803 family)